MSDSHKKRVLRLIKEYGGKLVCQKRHAIYRFPSGLKFTTPITPSDSRAWRNSLSCLKRITQRLREKAA